MPTHDPAKIQFIADGVQIDGFAPGTFLNIEYSNDMWTTTVGADGQWARSKSNDESAEITCTLMPGSSGNAKLEALRQLDAVDNRGVFPLMIKDPHSNTVHVSEGAYVKKAPTSVYAGEVQGKAWVIGTGRLKSINGSSTETP